MTELEQKIEALVRPFVAQLARMFASYAAEAFTSAVGQVSPAPRPPAKAQSAPKRRAGAKPKKKKNQAVAAAAAPAAAPTGSLAERIRGHLASTPGQRMDQLSKSLQAPVPKLQTEITKLLSAAVVRREGERRGVRYYVT